ncbi:MAG TPA: DNA primase [Burkholderiales bacterium]|nr:DNA primase [Burkholderiales bacterium]
MIPKSFVQELLGRVDVVDVVESYLPLKRAGTNLVACCPFHSEKTPSFTVSPTKQFYHCFGCGAHGSAIGFLMEYSGMGFVEAVKDLAARTGMKVPEAVPGPQEVSKQVQSEELTELLQRAAQFYKSELKRSEKAIAYLKGRGLTGEIAARFQVGFAPSGWQNLAVVFGNYQAKALVDAGLVIQGDEDKRYDRFRDRIMFPIVSPRGQVIGFGGRVLDDSEPKYLNSPETPLFEKGRELYGLFQARQAIRGAGRAVVVEGYMDVVALAQCGIGYAVATLGTATTPWHVQKLLRQTDEIVFCFDGDAAGRRAAWRALENSLSQLQDGKQVRFLLLPERDDPDSFVRREGRETFERLLTDTAMPLSTFLLKELTERADMGSAEGRAKFLQEAKPLVKQISAPILGLMLRKRLAELGGISHAELDERLEVRPSGREAGVPQRSPRRASNPYAKLLERVLAEPRLVTELWPITLPSPHAENVEASALFDLIEESRALHRELNVAGMIELLRARGHGATVQRLMPVVLELQRFNAEELLIEVRGSVETLLGEAEETRRTQLAKGVSSPGELSQEARALLSRAPVGGKTVKSD